MRLTNAARQSLEETVSRYQRAVDQAGPYLSSRGIDREAANTYRLGYVTGDHSADHDYVGRLAVPYLTPSGCIDVRYRAIQPDTTPKYLSRPGAGSHLFNVKALLVDSPVLYVCEGELDAITASQCGLPTVGVPGANNWRSHYRLLMQDYMKVVVLCDGDEAGRQFGKTIAREVDTAIPVVLPEGMDVNDLYLSGGKDAVLRMVEL